MHFKQIAEDLIACVWLLISLYVLFILLFTLDTLALMISELCLVVMQQVVIESMFTQDWSNLVQQAIVQKLEFILTVFCCPKVSMYFYAF